MKPRKEPARTVVLKLGARAVAERTSDTDPIRVDWLPLRGGGLVGMTFAPGKRCASMGGGAPWNRDLRKDMQRLAELGVKHLVTLMHDADFRTIQVTQAAFVGCANTFGILVTVVPVHDGGVLTRPQLRTVRKHIAKQRERSRPVAIHCVGGLGRTGFLSGILLRDEGYSLAETFGILQGLRGPDCPETPEQREALLYYQPR